MKKKVYAGIMILSLGLMAVSGYNAFKEYREYQAGIEEYKGLKQYVSVAEPVTEEETKVQEEAGTEMAKEPSLINVPIKINYDGLQGINDDFKGWLYYAPLEISYPIVRGEDNDYYTKYTFLGEENKSGAIFMDAYNWNDYDEYNTFIYGHNMRNGSMFGRLKELLDDEEKIVENNPYFYILTKEKSYMYEIFAVYNTNVNSDIYNLVNTREEQEENIAKIKEIATWLSDKEITADDKIVTLSTCYGSQTRRRTIVQGVLVAAEE